MSSSSSTTEKHNDEHSEDFLPASTNDLSPPISAAYEASMGSKRNLKKLTIYQLLLDSQLELKSEGDRITCSKTAKKRKRTNGIDNSRSPYISGLETSINSGESDRLRKYFEEHCNLHNCTFQIDMSVLSKDPNVPIFREIRGVPSILSYFQTTLQAIPDCIYLFWQKGAHRNPDNTREYSAECHMVGKRIYEINVIEDAATLSDQSSIESAIFALTSLAGGQTDVVSTVEPGSVITRQFPSANSTITSKVDSKGRRVKSLDSMNILVADGHVEFATGNQLPQPVELNHKGIFTWVIDTNKKIIRLKFVLA